MTATVMVVDDSGAERALLRTQLNEHGYQVVEAESGEQAVEICRDSMPDIILLDVNMPHLHGFDVLALLQADAELRSVPVVFLTGAQLSSRDAATGLRRGAHDYLRKSDDVSELIARIQAGLRVKALRDTLQRRNSELEQQAQTDPLTGVYKARFLTEHLRRLISSAERHGYGFAVVMVDIDDFRRVNAECGPNVGDEVLREVSERIRTRVRRDDVVGRLRADEFLVVGYTDGAGAHALAEALEARIAEISIPTERGDISVSVSVGTADWRGEDPQEIVRRAESALRLAREGAQSASPVEPRA
jgi:two-component system cell cycle response regulator